MNTTGNAHEIASAMRRTTVAQRPRTMWCSSTSHSAPMQMLKMYDQPTTYA